MTSAHSSSPLFDRARAVIPGGVNSPVRAYGSVGGSPAFLSRAEGPYVWDSDGSRYVDLVASWGPALLGHAHPEVVAAVRQAAEAGLSFGAPTTGEVELAEAIAARVGPVEQVRMVSTGTEATMTAVRLARGVTGRDVIVKFAGCYHGHVDSLLAEAGSGLATFGLPGSAGVPEAVAGQTIVIPYNDTDAVREVFAARGSEIAAVITEAAPANMGVIAPDDGFNAFLAQMAHDHGALMILDEVLTGFRVGPAGWWGVEQEFGSAAWEPDIFTFGKVVGGGMPLAALGGSAQIMSHLSPLGPVYQAGTLSGNPLAVAAGSTTLALADDDVYRRVDQSADVVREAATQALSAAGVPHVVGRAGNLFSVFFTDGPDGGRVRDYASASTQHTWRYAAFFHAMKDRGVALPPSAFEAYFLTAAHDDEALEIITDALPHAARAAAAASEEQ